MGRAAMTPTANSEYPSGLADPQPVSLRDVSKSYGKQSAVLPLSMEIAAGEMVALLGPSGCGKTTTLRMIAGFEPPDTGSVHIGDRDVTDIAPHRRRLGMVFQNYSLFPHMTVGENVAYGLKMMKVGRSERDRHVAAALAMIRLDTFADRFPRQLSGGQQQRVALARSLVTRPTVLLLDEPLGALDKNLREGMQFELRQLQKSLGITAVLVTHDQEEALTMADRVAVMSDGRTRQIGTPTEIYERPIDRFVAEFLGSANIWPATLDTANGNQVMANVRLGAQSARFSVKGSLESTESRLVLIALRPEKLMLSPLAQNPPAGVEGRIELTVFDKVFRGTTETYQLRAPGSDAVVLSYVQTVSSDKHFAIGEPLVASWFPGSAVILANTP
jgi:spermidine/putrescine ABC transporter ATP-binding subunit